MHACLRRGLGVLRLYLPEGAAVGDALGEPMPNDVLRVQSLDAFNCCLCCHRLALAVLEQRATDHGLEEF